MSEKKISQLIFLSVLLLLLLTASTSLVTAAAPSPVISEIRIDQPSTDTDEYFELAGVPGSSLNGLTYLVIGDGSGGSGVIEAVIDLTGNTIPASGFFVAAESTFTLGTANLTTSLNFENSDNVTHLLVKDFTGANGNDLDTNDDGTLDVTPWSEIVDLIALVEEPNPPSGTEFHYGPPSVGPDGSYVPGHIFVCSTGWTIGQFNPAAGDDTPGAANSCGAPATAANLVINEIDYDQPSTDAAEFIEIKNNDAMDVNLSAYSLKLVNGTGGGAAVYKTITLPDTSLASGDYFVVCGNAANVANCDLDVSPDTNLIQNGAPDAVALFFNDEMIDTVSYEGNTGAPYTEGSGVGLEDSSAQAGMSISRCPDGSDTNQNNVDFSAHVATPGIENACGGGGPGDFGVCGDPATFIHDVQGSGPTSPLDGSAGVILEGVVVGDFQDTATQLKGFFLQEEDTEVDANPLTSEGIFVYDNGFGVDVNVGDVIRVQGDVQEFYSFTELSNVSNLAVCSASAVASAATVTLPVVDVSDWEAFEGMLVHIPQTLYATGNYNQGQYGEVNLSVNGRLFNPTNVTTPGAAALALQDLNDRSRILLDDGSNLQNPPLVPYIGANNTLRDGDTISEFTGVVAYGFSKYRLHPTEPVNFARVNTRAALPPDVGGILKVASFNVLNYFTTIDTGDKICGPAGDLGCRGADSAAEFTRQRDKIIAAITAMNADVVGLMEMENNATTAIEDLVSGLNAVAGAGTYDYINTGTIGTDAIKVALIYKPGSVTPVGVTAILDSSVDPTFIDTKNRPSLAQSFAQNLTGQRFTVVVNHLKSKGSPCDDIGDPNAGDGQGNCNLTRTQAATALANWLATDPTGSGDPDFLIIGDMNAYAMEDPITAIKNAGYTDMIAAFEGTNSYSYVYDGQAGYLDHALANTSMADQITGVTHWHINADEPRALDYNDFNQPYLYNPDQYRASDHDPVLVGLNLEEVTAISLLSFTAEVRGNKVVLAWQTATETDNAGFNLYRADSAGGPWTKVNGSLIAANGDATSGASYTFTDRPGRGEFYYLLEDVNYFGQATRHDPVWVELGPAIRSPWFRPFWPNF